MITKTEEEVYNKLKRGLTINKIALQRGTTPRSVQKIVKNLKEKGFLFGNSCRGFVFRGTIPPSKNKAVRLHGQEFNIKFKLKGDFLYKHCKKFILDNNHIKIYENSLEIYSGHDFFGSTVWEARYKSLAYFKRFFVKLENTLHSLFKQIKQVNAHYSECDNELATELNKKYKVLNIPASDDGKIWATVDLSLNINEFEGIHSKTAYEDMSKVLNFFNDLRNNSPPNLSEQWGVICGFNKTFTSINDILIKYQNNMELSMETINKIFMAIIQYINKR